jgi:hypothetical protein
MSRPRPNPNDLNGHSICLHMCYTKVFEEVFHSLVDPQGTSAQLAVDNIADIGTGGNSPSVQALHDRYHLRL